MLETGSRLQSGTAETVVNQLLAWEVFWNKQKLKFPQQQAQLRSTLGPDG